jgi:hypothetical protein
VGLKVLETDESVKELASQGPFWLDSRVAIDRDGYSVEVVHIPSEVRKLAYGGPVRNLQLQFLRESNPPMALSKSNLVILGGGRSGRVRKERLLYRPSRRTGTSRSSLLDNLGIESICGVDRPWLRRAAGER